MALFWASRSKAHGGWGGSAHYPDPTAQSAARRVREPPPPATGTARGRACRAGACVRGWPASVVALRRSRRPSPFPALQAQPGATLLPRRGERECPAELEESPCSAGLQIPRLRSCRSAPPQTREGSRAATSRLHSLRALAPAKTLAPKTRELGVRSLFVRRLLGAHEPSVPSLQLMPPAFNPRPTPRTPLEVKELVMARRWFPTLGTEASPGPATGDGS